MVYTILLGAVTTSTNLVYRDKLNYIFLIGKE